MISTILRCAVALGMGSLACAAVPQHPVQAELVSENAVIQTGQPFWVALHLKMEDGWHTYWKNPGDTGIPTSIQWNLPQGFRAAPLLWPRPQRFDTPPLVSYGYEKEVLLLAEITPPNDLKPDAPVLLQAKASWLVCEKEACIPGGAELKLELPTAAAPQWNETWKPRFDAARLQIPADPNEPPPQAAAPPRMNLLGYILFAFLGGLILNLMPCVFPVLSIKILGFINQSGNDARALRRHGLIFALGVLVSFWILAAILLALRAGGQELGWGFQLQSPRFVAFIALLFFLLSLNLLGVFEIGSSLIRLTSVTKLTGFADSFLSGVLAAVVATPCTAPFMGVALAFALAQPPLVSFAVFTALGGGLAAPYVILSCSPALLRFIPKPGAWMESFKQAMAFPLLAAVAWLVNVLGLQTGTRGVALFLLVLLLAALAAWIYGRWSAPHRSAKTRVFAVVIAACVLAVSLLFAWNTNRPADAVKWETFSPERLEELKKQGKPVFIDFTAAWCATCQVNEITALNSEKVQRKFKERGVVLLKADWTNHDPVVTRALASYGRSSVPFYVLYGTNPAFPPQILPELLTPSIVLKALEGL
ncbi:MAG: protein-disulfide reductase DsbD domain-containing protein [bacterium]